MQKIFHVKIDALAHDGSGRADVSGVPICVHGMLPGEEGVVEAHKRKGVYVGTLKELSTASPSRKNPDELHYLSCSPWQVMEYPVQIEWKQRLLDELFSYYDEVQNIVVESAERFYGYRTKVEFSFCDREGETPIPLALAFHVRGGGSARVALPEGCLLASERMNRVALSVVGILRERGYASRDLKTLIIRESKHDGSLLAALFVTMEEMEEFDPSSIPGLSGMLVFHSDRRSPASVPTRLLWRWGGDHLVEEIDGVRIRYSWDSFFQNNVPMFKRAVDVMREYVRPVDRVLELYSGAGTIGLLLARNVRVVEGVEIVEGAVRSANENATLNAIDNYKAECARSETITEERVGECDVLVIDPPRAGVHPKLLTDILRASPDRIIYLSCNPETQARDYSVLSSRYEIVHVSGFDFYPNTPHVESLLVLKLRKE